MLAITNHIMLAVTGHSVRSFVELTSVDVALIEDVEGYKTTNYELSSM